MDFLEIRETPIWGLYEKGRNYHRLTGIYVDTDKNHRFFEGDQWQGAKLDGVEPVQKNFIRPIVKYKCAVIHDNLYSIVFESMNFENRAFRKQAEKICKLLNGYMARVWEQDQMDKKLRKVTKNAAINGEGIVYIYYDEELRRPVHEVIDKTDVYYGNENDEDIQSQPYILLRRRMPVYNAIELARSRGVSEEDCHYILGDNDVHEEAGDAAKQEVDDMVTIVYKMFKKNGTVHFSSATRYCDIDEEVDTGMKLYPVAHMTWEEKKGSARGEGEVKYLIPNQIEVNRTEMRRVLTGKFQAFPRTVADRSKISNPNALNTVGGIIWTNGQPVDDVNKIIGTIAPAQMSPDVKLLQDDLIQMSRELAGAGDAATGDIDPEQASGRAILAIQQAQRAPMTEQKEGLKTEVEDIARIDLEMLIVNSPDGIDMEEKITDPMTGEETYQMVHIPQASLEQVMASVKIEITPRSPYDRFAQEQTLENFLLNGLFAPQRIGEFAAYVEALDDDSVAPKQKLMEILERMKEDQKKIAMIDAQARLMQQRAQQFLMEDPDAQSSMMASAMGRMQAEQPMEEMEGV